MWYWQSRIYDFWASDGRRNVNTLCWLNGDSDSAKCHEPSSLRLISSHGRGLSVRTNSPSPHNHTPANIDRTNKHHAVHIGLSTCGDNRTSVWVSRRLCFSLRPCRFVKVYARHLQQQPTVDSPLHSAPDSVIAGGRPIVLRSSARVVSSPADRRLRQRKYTRGCFGVPSDHF